MEGNQQKLREAVVALLDAMYSLGCDEDTATLAAFVPDMADSSAKCLAAFRKAKDALSAQPRQCDVGTSEEQCKRWRKFCDTKRCCEICACSKGNGISADCFAKWAQMPYEEERKGETDGK